MNTRKFRAVGGFLDNTAYIEYNIDDDTYRLIAKPGLTVFGGEEWSGDRIYPLELAEELVAKGSWEEIKVCDGCGEEHP